MFKFAKFLALTSALSWIPDLIEGAVDVANQLDTLSDMAGFNKFEHLTEIIAEEVDKHCDDIPGWEALTEEARDRIIYGIAEVALLIARKAYGRKQASPVMLRINKARDACFMRMGLRGR